MNYLIMFTVAIIIILIIFAILMKIGMLKSPYRIQDSNDVELQLKNMHREMIIAWKDIRGLYFCNKTNALLKLYLCCHDAEIEVLCRNDKNLVDTYISQFHKAYNEMDVMEYSHPKSLLNIKTSFIKFIQMLGFGIVACIIVRVCYGYIMNSGGNSSGIDLLISAAIVLSIIIYKKYSFGHPTYFSKLIITDDNIAWNDEFGSYHTYKLSDACCVIAQYNCGNIKFKDGTELSEVEKTKDWPLLRKKLLIISDNINV